MRVLTLICLGLICVGCAVTFNSVSANEDSCSKLLLSGKKLIAECMQCVGWKRDEGEICKFAIKDSSQFICTSKFQNGDHNFAANKKECLKLVIKTYPKTETPFSASISDDFPTTQGESEHQEDIVWTSTDNLILSERIPVNSHPIPTTTTPSANANISSTTLVSSNKSADLTWVYILVGAGGFLCTMLIIFGIYKYVVHKNARKSASQRLREHKIRLEGFEEMRDDESTEEFTPSRFGNCKILSIFGRKNDS